MDLKIVNVERFSKSTQEDRNAHLSHEKNIITFHYTACLIGIRDPYNGLL